MEAAHLPSLNAGANELGPRCKKTMSNMHVFNCFHIHFIYISYTSWSISMFFDFYCLFLVCHFVLLMFFVRYGSLFQPWKILGCRAYRQNMSGSWCFMAPNLRCVFLWVVKWWCVGSRPIWSWPGGFEAKVTKQKTKQNVSTCHNTTQQMDVIWCNYLRICYPLWGYQE